MPPAHPVADIFPMMDGDKLQELADDIKKNGQIHPIVMHSGKILDGRNRWRACSMVGVKPKTVVYKGADPIAYAIGLNVKRRHLTPIELGVIAASVRPLFEAEAKERQKEAVRKGNKSRHSPVGNKPQPTGKPRDNSKRSLHQAAAATGSSIAAATAMASVEKKAPEVFELAREGKLTAISEATALAKSPPEERVQIVDGIKSGLSFKEALAKHKEEKSSTEPIAVLGRLLESIRKHAVGLRGAAQRLSELTRSMKLTEMKSPEIGQAGMALLQARGDINSILEALRLEGGTK